MKRQATTIPVVYTVTRNAIVQLRAEIMIVFAIYKQTITAYLTSFTNHKSTLGGVQKTALIPQFV